MESGLKKKNFIVLYLLDLDFSVQEVNKLKKIIQRRQLNYAAL